MLCYRGNLFRHLRDLAFYRPDGAPANAEVARDAAIVLKKKSGTSGPCGSKYRKNAVARGVLKRPSSHFTRLKRGIDYKARRASEQANRAKRPGGDKVRKARTRIVY